MIDKTWILKDFFSLVEPDLKKMKKGCLVLPEPVTVRLHK
jgi:hypothetical protein